MPEMGKVIELAHGSGGQLSWQLTRELFLPHFGSPELQELDDGALLGAIEGAVVFTTDSFVVDPLFFPGGDIGSLAVYGTVNDLAVMGARPLYLSCGFIIEEGLEIALLERVVKSMAAAAKRAGVRIVTGDTKVVGKGEAHHLFINTSGIGEVLKPLKKQGIAPGDKILINGGIGEHGIAVLGARGEFDLEFELESDCAPVNRLVEELLPRSEEIKFMRDPTRGGVASALNELVQGQTFGIMLYEDALPIRAEVREVCELLGFDPLSVANEGKLLMVVAANEAEELCKAMRTFPEGKEASIIGEVSNDARGKVVMETHVGGHRIIDFPLQEQFPRIC